MRNAAWCSCPRAPPRRTSTARIARATTCTRTACSRSTPPRARLRWHFQFVKHDVLDRDLPTAPTLVTLRVKGKRVDALVQTTKQGFVFVLDRDTGKPVFPVEEVAAPASDVPGEVAHPTYLRPTLPAPYARQQLTADDLTTRTPEAASWARERFAQMRSDGPFKPLTSGVDTTIYPGFDGGAEWGGPAYDPDTGLLYVNANEMAWLGSLAPNDTGRSTGKSIYLRDCAACHGDSGQGSPPQFPSLAGIGARMTPADVRRASCARAAAACPRSRTCRTKRCDAMARFLFEGVDVPAGRTRPLADQPGRIASRVTGAGSIRKVIRRSARPGARSTRSTSPRGKYRLAHPVRRISRARREGHEGHGQRKLRRPAGDLRRPAVHRRNHPRSQVPRVRQTHRQTAVGNGAALLGRCHADHLPDRRPAVRGDLRERRQGARRLAGRRLPIVRAAGA